MNKLLIKENPKYPLDDANTMLVALLFFHNKILEIKI